ncbi:MAG: sulfurtransferase TusA family protein [Sphingomonas sp.]|jgi:tRNA 2-thiouridine synthesizing protein A
MATIDARGMRCPWPAIRLARALRDGAGAVTIYADDPAAQDELDAVAKAAGRRLRRCSEHPMPVFCIE